MNDANLPRDRILSVAESIEDESALREERELIQRALGGDMHAKTEIVLVHQQNVYNLALRLTGNRDEAENILQDTFLKVFEKLEDFRGGSCLGTWIHRIAANAALMKMRGRKGKYFVPIEEEPPDEETGERDMSYVARSLDLDPLESTLNNELRERLEIAISNLPGVLRTAFVLKDLEGLSLQEIMEQTGKSLAAVKADLHRARVRLRAELVEFAGEMPHD